MNQYALGMENSYVEGPDECPWCEAEPFEYEDGELKAGQKTIENLGLGSSSDDLSIDEDRLKQTDDGFKIKLPCPECGHPIVVLMGVWES